MNKKLTTPKASRLKLRIVELRMRNLDVARTASDLLPPEEHLSEQMITRLITIRKIPSRAQAAALATVLDCVVADLFMNLEDG